jgi:hypothetical protein
MFTGSWRMLMRSSCEGLAPNPNAVLSGWCSFAGMLSQRMVVSGV